MPAPNAHHETVELVTPAGERVQIDEGIAGLIQSLWAAGVSTESSCQGLYGRAFIVLPDGVDLGVVLRLLPKGATVSLHYPHRLATYIAEWRV